MRKVVLVTGSSSGLGKSIAVQAAHKGHKVYASMRDLDRRSALEADAKAAGVAIEYIQLDVQSEDSVTAAIALIIGAEGRIDTLINNAGAGYIRPTEQATLPDVEWVMDVNFKGVVRCTKAVLPHMRQARRGHVINIGSVGGLVGQPFREFYCAAKFAVEGYTETLACYVTPHFGVNFTVVEPGGMATQFGSAMRTRMERTGGMPKGEYLPIYEEHIRAAQALGAEASQSPGEVARVVVRCIDDAAPPIRLRTSEWGEQLCDLKTRADPDGQKSRDKVMHDFLNL
ncbi:SDR family oxidoreductase [Ruegeria sp. MALMAid1280]|uniref:SDR family oxidoreductase n=1 Tax=Ruegeria sp. MALMAid1280 TaxID=3411634 RepID=UPI003BA134BC